MTHGDSEKTRSPLEKFDHAAALYLENQRYGGASEQTVKNYAGRIALFRSFWLEHHEQQPAGDPETADFRAWRNSLLDAGKKPSTVAQYLAELRYFFEYSADPELGAEQVYEGNPVSRRLIPKIQKRPYDEILQNSDVAKLWQNEPPTAQLKPNWPRNYAIVVLLLTSEIRNAELLDLRLCDVNLREYYLTVESGKGGKFRTVDLPEIAVSALKIYLQSGLRPADAPETAPLFGTNSDQSGHKNGTWHRGTSQWLSSVVERHVAAVTGVKNVRSHDLRHIGARLDLTSGLCGLEMLQGKLGHSSPNTTQIYSGRLTSRRQTVTAREVLAAQEEQAQRNRNLIRFDIA